MKQIQSKLFKKIETSEKKAEINFYYDLKAKKLFKIKRIWFKQIWLLKISWKIKSNEIMKL